MEILIGQIEKNVAYENKPMGQHKYDFPFEKMEVGDSFIVKGLKATQVGASSASYIRHFAKDKSFKTRKVDVDTVRCWRVK